MWIHAGNATVPVYANVGLQINRECRQPVLAFVVTAEDITVAHAGVFRGGSEQRVSAGVVRR